MPKITQLGPNHYSYKCECGKDIELFTDAEESEIKRVTKCWSCLAHDGFMPPDMVSELEAPT